jgi:RHS repeat-associated protein
MTSEKRASFLEFGGKLSPRDSQTVRKLGWVAGAALLVIAALASTFAPRDALGGTPLATPRSCGYSGGPACPDAAPALAPWQYWTFYPAIDGTFNSVGEVETAWTNYYLVVGCTISFSSPVAGYEAYNYGVLISAIWNVPMSGTTPNAANAGSGTPCSYSGTATYGYYGVRGIACPTPINITYSSSPLTGPYCPTTTAPLPYKQACLTCGDVQGDGVDASNQDKIETATDYGGVGSDPISFVRTYSSQAATEVVDGTPPPLQLLGVGWQATYFQYLLPVSITDSTTTYNTVYAYRPNGSVLIFNEYGSTYSPDGDVKDSLVQTGSGWQYQTADDTIETYNALGQLVSIAPRGKSLLTVNYNAGSVLGDPPTSVSDAFGHSLTFSYLIDAYTLQRLASITDSAGNTVQYSYDSYENLTSVTNRDGTTQSYAYGYGPGSAAPNSHLLMTLTDEAGVAYGNWTYLSWPLAPLTSQRAGGVNSYRYYGSSSLTVTDPLGTSRTYNQTQILGVNHPTSSSAVCPGCGEDAARTYDANGNITSRTDFNGNENVYSYDLLTNRETSRTEAYGTSAARTISTTWDSSWEQPDQITEPNRTTSFTYDSMGNTLTKTVTDTTVLPNVARTWTYTYDSYGRMLTAKGPRTDVSSTTTYTYYTCTTGYQCGELHTVTDPVGNVTTYNTYDAYGEPLTITDPNGVVTTLTYDTRQRLTSRQVGSETTSFSYYSTGLLEQVTLPDGSYLLYTYDTAHRLTQISDGAGNSSQYTLDAMGNRTAVNTYDPSSTLHRTHTRVINSLNELYQDVNAAGTSAVTTTYGYDSNGNQTGIAAPASRTTANAYDPLNRLTQITDPASGVTSFSYDTEDDLTAVQDPLGLTTSYSYNGFGDVTAVASPDTGSTAKTYDSGGNVASSTDARGAASLYSYDASNRVTSIAYKLGSVTDQTLAFGYDSGTYGKGRLTSASDANHSLSWTYDGLGRVTGKGLTIGSVTLSVGYGYMSGDRTALVTPSGQSVVYGFNSNHQITSIAVNGTNVLTGVTYEPFGGVNGWSWGDGTTASRTFNGDGLISQIVAAGVTLGYSFDYANRITGISDSSNTALTWSYGYDALDRLTNASTSAITDGWTYDANGNQLTQTGTTAITYSITSGSNQLSAATGGLTRSYSYDAAGNTVSYGSLAFSYNNRGRMAVASGGSTDYLYNALGQMIEKSGTAGTTIFMQDESGHLIGEYDGSGNLIEETVWMGDIPIATLQPNGSGVNIFYVHTDHLNSPRKIAQPTSGTLAWRWDSDPFGTAAPNDNPAGLGAFAYNLRFPGQYYMVETGLNQNWMRDYDPITGKYIESDPIGLRGGINTYAYVSDNPVWWSDPLGLCKVILEYSRVVLNYSHISIYTSDSDGNMWFAGGPAHDPIRGGGALPQGQDYGPDPWGRLVGSYGTLTQPLPSSNTRVVVDDGKPCSCYNQSFENSIDRINSMNIPYDPFVQNSNSLAGTILNNAGITAPDNWPYTTPGYSNNLNNYVPGLPPVH